MTSDDGGPEDPASGLATFARYAWPPNRHGHCGPADHQALRDYLEGRPVDARPAALARSFDGPLPYLRAIAGDRDVFAREVVEAYWLGNDLLDRADPERLAQHLATFRNQPSVPWPDVEAALPHGRAHHTFHVLVTYPWLALLGRPGGHALDVLDRCRVRIGTVTDRSPTTAGVRTRCLQHERGRLRLEGERTEQVSLLDVDVDRVEVGDVVAVHWDWLCDRLDARQAADAARHDAGMIAMVNRVLLAASPRTA